MTSVIEARARIRVEYQRLYDKSADNLDLIEVVNAVFKGTAKYLDHVQHLGNVEEGLRVAPPHAKEYFILFFLYLYLLCFYFYLFFPTFIVPC
jgi:hypothetical protein